MSEPKVTPLGNGRFEVADESGHRLAHAVRSSSATWVFLDGQVHVIATATGAARAAGRRDDEFALAAPMPATVSAVHVEPGQQVASGDILVTLEAMKMELAIRAPRDGRVGKVACRPGDLVQPGVPLVELE